MRQLAAAPTQHALLGGGDQAALHDGEATESKEVGLVPCVAVQESSKNQEGCFQITCELSQLTAALFVLETRRVSRGAAVVHRNVEFERPEKRAGPSRR